MAKEGIPTVKLIKNPEVGRVGIEIFVNNLRSPENS